MITEEQQRFSTFPSPVTGYDATPTTFFPTDHSLSYTLHGKKEAKHVYVLCVYETGFVHVHVFTSTQKFPTWQNAMLNAS